MAVTGLLGPQVYLWTSLSGQGILLSYVIYQPLTPEEGSAPAESRASATSIEECGSPKGAWFYLNIGK